MTQTKVIGSHCTRITRDAGITRITYHNTDVVTITPDQIILNTGGWYTQTTKSRMNQASQQYDLRFRVFQQAGGWFVEYNNDVFQFTDDILILQRTVA